MDGPPEPELTPEQQLVVRQAGQEANLLLLITAIDNVTTVTSPFFEFSEAFKPQDWERISNEIAREEAEWAEENLSDNSNGAADLEIDELDDFVQPVIDIAYLKPIFANPRNTWGPQNTRVEIRFEDIGDVLNLQTCHAYLKKTYPQRRFSKPEIQRCFDIFLAAIRKTTHVEGMTDLRMDVCYNHYYKHYGTFVFSRHNQLEYMFNSQLALFACYDINTQTENGWKAWPNERGSLTKVWQCFTLKELIENDEKYELFRQFWDNLPDFQQTYDTLREYFPKDIIQLIINHL